MLTTGCSLEKLRSRKRGPSPSSSAVFVDPISSASSADFVPPPAPSAPTTLPLVQIEGTNAWGYPKSYVDKAGFRSLLLHSKFDELDRYFAELQDAFEADPTKEYWPVDASESFASTEAKLRPLFDAWADHSPSSFAPYLARASHYLGVGYEIRGSKYVKDTPPAALEGMRVMFARAQPDIEKALAQRPRLVAAYRQRIRMDLAIGKDTRPTIEAALRVCPSCFQVRVSHMVALEPKWGGSWVAMQRFARSTARGQKTPLDLLEGYVDVSRADEALASDVDASVRFAEKALARGEHWEFLTARARARRARKEYALAEADLVRADELRPMNAGVLRQRAQVRADLNAWEAAGHDVATLLSFAPEEAASEKVATRVVEGLVYAGWQAHLQGRQADAVRLYDLAAKLDPSNIEVRRRRPWVIAGPDAGKAPATDDELATLEAAARAAPDDFDAQRAFDYALARRGQYARVIPVWDAYLARHPDDTRAYVERAGAQRHLGDLTRAFADVNRACELGSPEGCKYAKQLQPK
ncbi:GTP cyclohydrolase III (methanopterin) [Labilithrix luteola]|uniref:GTP cyclohydrolase III (Methanopterin) n=1 Tax=Labilithrix luteola TaxID=1391654 RepID=A0A0K1QDD2_9BACT|nr:GTP cyclohydrolase III (methanopterin) [Labilithrix luteola]